MRLITLEVWNWFSYRHAKVPLDKRGVVLVLAENKDSVSGNNNFSGKSALFADAIPWCLYAQTIREKVFGKKNEDFKIDDVINDKTGRNCCVAVRFTGVDGKTYLVSRYRKDAESGNHVYLELFHENKRRNLTGETDAETNEKIVTLTGMTYETYCSTVLFSQGAVKRFTQSTDAERRKAIEEFMNLEVFTTARELVLADKKKLDEKLEIIESDFDSISGRLSENQDACKEFKAELDSLMKTTRTGPAGKLKDLQSGRKSLQKQLSNVEETIRQSVKAQKKYEKLVLSAKDRDKLKQRDIDTQSALSICGHQITSLRNNIENYEEEIVRFKAGSVCSECMRKMTQADVNAYRKILHFRVVDLKKSLIVLEREQATNQKTLFAVREELKDDSDQCDLVAREVDARHEAERQLSKLENKDRDLVAEIRELQNIAHDPRINHLRAQIRNQEAKANQLSRKLQGLNARKREYDRERAVLKFWLDGFSPYGIKDFCFDRLLKFINGRLEYYARKLTRGELKIKLGKNGKQQIAVELSYLQSKKYVTASAGQAKRADLCIMLAFRSVVEQAVQPCNMLCFDEFDASLDSRGLDMLLDFINEEAKKRGSIFLITHNNELAGYVNNVSMVTYADGESRVA